MWCFDWRMYFEIRKCVTNNIFLYKHFWHLFVSIQPREQKQCFCHTGAVPVRQMETAAVTPEWKSRFTESPARFVCGMSGPLWWTGEMGRACLGVVELRIWAGVKHERKRVHLLRMRSHRNRILRVHFCGKKHFTKFCPNCVFNDVLNYAVRRTCSNKRALMFFLRKWNFAYLTTQNGHENGKSEQNCLNNDEHAVVKRT